MRVQDCNLDVDLVVMAPVRRSEPEDSWLQARESRSIPPAVFELYRRARYMSFGSAPGFLADEDNILFSYFGMLLTSVKESLVDAAEELRRFTEAQSQTYDPGKKTRGEPWDRGADERARRHFRYLLLSLQGALDGFADLVAVFLTGLIPDLRVGRAQFTRIERWLNRPLPTTGLLLTPPEHFLRQLYDTLRPLVYAGAPERDWLPLMRLYRNKAAHLNDAVFRYVVLHDNNGRFHTFLPRQWPYLWEKHMKPADPNRPKDPSFFSRLCSETLVHQDVITYVRGLTEKVSAVVAAGMSVLNAAFDQFRDFPPNRPALAELQGSSEAYAFEYFPGGDTSRSSS